MNGVYRLFIPAFFLALSILAFNPAESYASVPVSSASDADHGSGGDYGGKLDRLEAYLKDLETDAEWASMQDETNGLDNTALFEIRDILKDIYACVLFITTMPPALFVIWLIVRPIFYFLG